MKHWDDLTHIPLEVQRNTERYDEFVSRQFSKIHLNLDRTTRRLINEGKEYDHMNRKFATYIASAIKFPQNFSEILKHLHSWMKLTNEQSLFHFKAKVLAIWLQEKQAAGMLSSTASQKLTLL